MKRIFLIGLFLPLMSWGVMAQQPNLNYRFYGQVRTDFYYNSRANAELVDGLFHLYPKDRLLDANGKDLNATPDGGTYLLYSRVGMDITSKGKTTWRGKIEVDFRGSGSSYSIFRLRHAFLEHTWSVGNKRWVKVLVGQTWHPLFGTVYPRVLNLGTGAPYQPFSRAPQVRASYEIGPWQLMMAAVWQSQFLSQGIDPTNATKAVRSQAFLKKGLWPECYTGVDYKRGPWSWGGGVEVLSLKPRTNSIMPDGKIYSVNERITTVSCELHGSYTTPHWFVAGKSVWGANLTQTLSLGGFGISNIDSATGRQEYTPLRYSTSWINAVHGVKWKKGIFAGYAKNLGTSQPLATGTVLYGTGTELDRLSTVGLELSYNKSNWQIGAEYTLTMAHYGNLNRESGQVSSTHAVCNHRIVGVAIWSF
ncbi:MAG: hypothetical protein SPJ97_05875 [Bacteroides sp.]|nr:hypothetical protein [Bacteroides sp.]